MIRWIKFIATFIATGSFVLITVFNASAQRLDPQDLKYLPDVCKYTWDGIVREAYDFGLENAVRNENIRNDPKYRKLIKYHQIYGPGLIAMHHYCRGLKKAMKAQNSCLDQECREYQLNSAIGEFNYVISHTNNDFIFRPNLYNYIGEIQFHLKEYTKAVHSFKTAIEYNKKYDTPYINLSKVFLKIGDKKNAVNILRVGLKDADNIDKIKKQLKKIQ